MYIRERTRAGRSNNPSRAGPITNTPDLFGHDVYKSQIPRPSLHVFSVAKVIVNERETPCLNSCEEGPSCGEGRLKVWTSSAALARPRDLVFNSDLSTKGGTRGQKSKKRKQPKTPVHRGSLNAPPPVFSQRPVSQHR